MRNLPRARRLFPSAQNHDRSATAAAQADRPACSPPRWTGWLAALLALLSLAGCFSSSGDDALGQLVVRWKPAGGSCADAGIATVRLSVQSGQVVDAELADIDCERGFFVVDVAPGVHTVRLTGYGPGGAPIATAPPESVLVTAGSSQSTAVLALAAKVGSLKVAWRFAGSTDAVAQGCAQHQLGSVLIEVLVGANIVAEKVASCADGAVRLDGIPAGPAVVKLVAQSFPELPSYTGQASTSVSETVAASVNLSLAPAAPRGRLTALWTVGGLPPALACAQAGIEAVTVYVLSTYKVKVEAQQQVACTAGGVEFESLTVGKRWVMVVASVAGGGQLSGLPQVAGPYEVTEDSGSGPVALVAFPASVSAVFAPSPGPSTTPPVQDPGATVRWAFDAGFAATASSCSAHGVSTVRVELLAGVAAGSTVLAWLEAPCALGMLSFSAPPAGAVAARATGKNAQGVAVAAGQVLLTAGQADVTLAPLGPTVSWTVQGAMPAVGCAQAALANVTVQFMPPAGSGLPVKTLQVACQAGSVPFSGPATPGQWQVRVSGVNQGGLDYGTAPDEWVSLPVGGAAAGSVVAVDLVRTTATVTVTWKVQSTSMVTCESADTELHILNKTGADYQSTVPCKQGTRTFVGIKPGLYFLSVTALNQSGETVLQQASKGAPFTVKAGEDSQQTVELVATK